MLTINSRHISIEWDGFAERLQTEVTILDEMKAVHSGRGGKRLILNGKTAIAMEELVKKPEKAENMTRPKKRRVENQGRGVMSSDEVRSPY